MYSLSLLKFGSATYASENTQLAKDFYESGEQSKQAELDELKLKILKFIEDNVIEVDYDEYRFTGNFIDADKLKEILK